MGPDDLRADVFHSPQMREALGIADFTVDDATPVVLERFRVTARI